ncbi:MAG: calcium:proton antiporter [Gaiellales bacterium]
MPSRSLLTLNTRHAAIPIAALALFVVGLAAHPSNVVLAGFGIVLALAVLEAVRHAEVVAHRVGEPLGSLILAVSVTIIEVGLIVVLMSAHPESTATVARDTVFSAAMIACNGIVGGALVIGTVRGRVATFNPEGVGAAVAAIAALATLCLILPNYTLTTTGPYFSPAQLVFAAVASLAIYIAFVSAQTLRHRDLFLEADDSGSAVAEPTAAASHDVRPTRRAAGVSLVLLMISLIAVVGLAKLTTPLIESAVDDAGLPQSVVAVSIALLVLLPEAIAALRASHRGDVQKSLNLAYGSVMASIGLTIPVIAMISLAFDYRLALGLPNAAIVLLALTVAVATLTIVPGRSILLQGVVHLSIFSAFIVLAFNP